MLLMLGANATAAANDDDDDAAAQEKNGRSRNETGER